METTKQELNFSELPQTIAAELQRRGITEPTNIQSQTFHPITDGHDILGQSMTGSGKTLAFSLPLACMHMKNSEPRKGHKILVLVPTRELADQVNAVFNDMLYPCKLRSTVVVGGASYRQQEQALARQVEVIVGTPGRVADLIKKNTLSLQNIQTFVLDEVDQMLDIGFAKELNFIRSQLPQNIQTLFFSATLNRGAKELAVQALNNPIEISCISKEQAPLIEHSYCLVKKFGKPQAVQSLLEFFEPKQALIFCETKRECSELSQHLNSKGFDSGQLHSDFSLAERKSTIATFKSGRLSYLIATNVAARGIHINGLPLVINYTVPKDQESYTHRAGRTGRAGATGKAWTLISQDEHQRYMRLFNSKFKPKSFTLPSIEDLSKTLLDREMARLSSKETPQSYASEIVAKLSSEQMRMLLTNALSKRLDKVRRLDPKELQWTMPANGRLLQGRRRHSFQRRDNRRFRSNSWRRNGTR